MSHESAIVNIWNNRFDFEEVIPQKNQYRLSLRVKTDFHKDPLSLLNYKFLRFYLLHVLLIWCGVCRHLGINENMKMANKKVHATQMPQPKRKLTCDIHERHT